MPLIAFISPPGSPGADLACRLAVHGLRASGLATLHSPPGRWRIPYVISMPESSGGVDTDPFVAPTYRNLCVSLDGWPEAVGLADRRAEDAFEVVALRAPVPGFSLPGRAAFHVRLQHRRPADLCAGWPTQPPLPTLTLPELDDAEQASLEAGCPAPHLHALAARIAEIVLECVGSGLRQAERLRWPSTERRRLPVRGRTGNGRGR